MTQRVRHTIQTDRNLRTQSRIRMHQGRNRFEPFPQELSRATSLKLCLTSKEADASYMFKLFANELQAQKRKTPLEPF